MQKGEVRNPVTVLLLAMFTCGIYAVYYAFFALPEDINKGLGREEFNGVKELLLTVVTCGAWGIWYYWRAAEALVELQRAWGVEPQMDAPILFIMNFVGIGPLFVQQSLNNAWENGAPGGAGHGGAGGADGF
jgi:hypothetical protein